MVEEVRIYVEGGGDGKETKAPLRRGFSAFLSDLVERARNHRVRWQIIACGPRDRAFRDFRRALADHPEAFNVLLVDSEGPVTATPRQHLAARDGWQITVTDDRCHLMVQMMEAWFLADRAVLRRFYGDGLRENALPGSPDVEQIAKAEVASALRAATRGTQRGRYHKTRHAPKLLADLDVPRVRASARHCDRLFSTLEQQITPPRVS